jgi:phosphohistidine phosphatase
VKRLALLRHAKSSWADSELCDFDRPLKKRGIKAAEAMGEELRRRDIAFDLVLASPAKRIVETIACFEKGYGRGLDSKFERGIYEASALSLWQIIERASNGADSLLLVGHQPGLQALATMVASRGDPHHREIRDYFPTAAFAMIAFDADDWRGIEPGTGRVELYLTPRALAD